MSFARIIFLLSLLAIASASLVTSRQTKGKKGKKTIPLTVSGKCDTIVASKCLGSCSTAAADPIKPPPTRLLRDDTTFTMSSLSYTTMGSGGGGKKKSGALVSYCLGATLQSYCQFLSASAQVSVNGQVIASDVDLSTDGVALTFPVPLGSTIDVDTTLILDPLVTCVTQGSYTFYLATD